MSWLLNLTDTVQCPSPASNSLQLPSIWKPLQLVGGTSGAVIALFFLSFFLTGALGLSLAGWRLGSAAGAGACLLILLGLLLLATGVADAVLH